MTDPRQARDARFERITAADIEPGDMICETRTADVYEVEEIESIGPSSRYIRLFRGGRIRPRHTTPYWRLREEAR